MRQTTILLVWLGVIGAGCAASDLNGSDMKDQGPRSDGGKPLPQLGVIVEPAEPELGKPVTLKAVIGVDVDAYTWTILDPALQTVTFIASTKGSEVTFDVKTFGTYQATCRAVLSYGLGQQEVTIYPGAVDPSIPVRRHRLRIIPRKSTGLPPTDVELQIGARDEMGKLFNIDQNVLTSMWTIKVNNTSVGANVRLFNETGVDAQPRDIYVTAAGTQVKAAGRPNALILPDETLGVPADLKEVDPGKKQELILTAGEVAWGEVRKGTSPVAGAKVVLYTTISKIRVPSTQAITGADGKYQIQQRPGTEGTLTIAPPQDAGLPVALIAKVPALDPTTRATSKGWVFTYNSTLAPVVLDASVTRAKATSPAVGVTATFSASGASAIGKLELDDESTTAVISWKVSRQLTSDVQGKLVDAVTKKAPSLPQGLYVAELWPGPGETSEQGHMLLKGQDVSKPLSLSLGQRVKLQGKVARLGGVAFKTLVTAAGSVGTFSTTTSTESFELQVDDQSTYMLRAQPIGMGSNRFGAFVVPQLAINGGQVLGSSMQLPTAAVIMGRLTTTTSSATGCSEALIRVWCDDVGCDKKLVIEETQATTSCEFTLRIPISTSTP
jgi:hypothetical protein